ncbi:PREDICTED: serine/threonine-protein phosphatase 6 regulatory ankyrin repeat subunit A-like [Amphimedon queenslandica]|uniref:Ankyrin repeat protein n=1 Tax=Amphimedon queenslandica TaxID=400682 RepID=A0AAN0JRQ6_AMPQE|nr:PREDICTED: serine/threonine-protein phosphatase 6 regulatory ankyrin repeat subunit A-like [Amphimedon queenslandica]|eukprot:XP_019859682.1 PREDICTED: serine/threonine-protein phosphatase 6 regulatory ankyrin repeat subunit A-like [Amphimedon queenslandica]
MIEGELSVPNISKAPVLKDIQKEKVMFTTKEDEEEVLHPLIELNKSFASLMRKVRTEFFEKVASDPKLLTDLTTWIETYMHWNDKLTNASLDETFNIIHPFYDFIDCSLIVDMSEEFLCDVKFNDDEKLNIVNKLQNYRKEADKLRFSAQVKHLHKSLQTIYEGHIPDTSNMPIISMKLHNQWHGSDINVLSLLIHNLLPIGQQQSIMKYITITPGSVNTTSGYSLIEYTGEKLQFMHFIGILNLYINDHQFLQQEDVNMSFTFELHKATTAGKKFLIHLDQHTNEEGKTALMLACERGHEDIVHSLLSAGANVDIQDNKGWTALMIAGMHNHCSIIHILLQANANLHLKASDGSNAAMIASYNGNYEVFELLISKGVDYKYQREDGWNALMMACENGHTQIVELLLKEQVDPNNGHTQVVELLLKERVDPDVQDKDGHTALMAASSNGHYEVVKLLLEWEADPTIKTNKGHNAISLSKDSEISLLIYNCMYKKDVETVTSGYDTADISSMSSCPSTLTLSIQPQ